MWYMSYSIAQQDSKCCIQTKTQRYAHWTTCSEDLSLCLGVLYENMWRFHWTQDVVSLAVDGRWWPLSVSRTLWICGSLLRTSFLSSMRFWWICVNSYQAVELGMAVVEQLGALEPLNQGSPWIRLDTYMKKTPKTKPLTWMNAGTLSIVHSLC